MEEKIIGPKLTDAEFFAELDTNVPGVKKAVELFDSGDASGAYSAFGESMRALLLKDGFFRSGAPEEFTEKLKEAADKAADHIMVSVGVPMQFGDEIDWYANPTHNQYKEWTWQLSRHGEIQTLARAYRASGDERYAKEAAFMFDSWIKQAICPVYNDSPYHCVMTWRTIEAGIRMMVWPYALHALAKSPYLTDELLVKVFKSVYEHAMRLSSTYTHGNWLFIELGGMARLVGGLPVFKKNGEWIEGIIKHISACVCSQVYPDSTQYELAPSYQYVAMNCAMGVERVLSEYGIEIPEVFYKQIRKMTDFFVKMRMADDKIPPINDSHACEASQTVRHFYNTYGGSEIAEWIITGGVSGKAPDFNTCVLPYAGLVAFRTGWGDGDVSAFFDGGKFGRDHTHEDRLNFLVYSDKRPLVYEFGTYAYDNSPMRHFCTQSHGHNVVTVNDLGQNRISTKIWEEAAYIPIKEDLRYCTDGDIEYAFAYYNGEWGNPKYDGEGVVPKKLATHLRSIIMIKGEKPSDTLFIAYDRMLASGDKRIYKALWHLNVDNVEPIEGGYTCPELTVLAGGFDKLECYKGVEESKPLGWISRSNIQGDYYQAPQLIFERSGCCESFVTLFALGANDEIAACSVECDNKSVTVKYKDGKKRVIDINALDAKATIV